MTEFQFNKNTIEVEHCFALTSQRAERILPMYVSETEVSVQCKNP